MSQDLVIVESPSKAKTIGKYLGRGFLVKASVGHVRDLPTKELGVDIEAGFKPKYETIKGKEKVLKELKAAAKTAQRILLAPDPDREGEAIAWHIAQYLKIKDKPVQRVSFNEITKHAVLAAMEQPQSIDTDKFNSQQARRILDRLVGYKISPLLWKKVKRGLSAGRVQSVAVRLVVEREQEIESFEPVEYWEIFVELAADEPPTFTARLATRDGKKLNVGNREEAEAICRELSGRSYAVADIARKTHLGRPAPPFITSTLQQMASRRLRLSPARVMRIAQELYEGIDIDGEGPQGLITYMRTDSVRVAAEAQRQAREYLVATYGAAYVPEKPNFYKSRKSAQEAHEAIRPTDFALPPEKLKGKLSGPQLKVYDLIWKRFMASQMTPAEFAVTTVQIANGPYGLTASDKKETFAGHLAVFRDESDAEKEEDEDEPQAKLPPLTEGQAVREQQVERTQKFTQPPSRYTEATLIRELEEKGIGRPSTYAAILSTILDKGYVEKIEESSKPAAEPEGKKKKVRGNLRPTDLGRAVTGLLVQSFPDILNVSFTARMEDQLDEVEIGKVDWKKLLADFWGPFLTDLERAEAEMKNLKREGENTGIACQECADGQYVVKYGRNGAFLGCNKYPECRSTKNFRRDDTGKIVVVERRKTPRDEPALTDKQCPQCGSPMVLRYSRKGSRFFSCSTFPKCKGTLAYETGVPCPKEGCPGAMVERAGPRGIFWGCSAFPNCRTVMKHEPLPRACPKCGSPYLQRVRQKDGHTVLSCPVKECDYEEPEEMIVSQETPEA